MANQINAIQRQTAALCCVARNENRYLKEWVDYHLGIGFSKIYIYDVGDAGDERCDSLDLGENVHVVNSFRGRRKRGNVIVDAYKKCYAEIGGSVKWIMYLGVNEFFALEKHSCVSDFLLDFIKSKGAVQCIHFNCRSYGSGGAEKYEDRPVRERFTTPSGNESYDKRYRSIYRTKIRSMEFVGHYCARNLHFTYNSDGSHCGNWILPTTRTVTYAGGHVDWYVTKSREEYAESGNRSPLYGNGLGMNFYNEFNHCEGRTIETPAGLGSAAAANIPLPNAGIGDGVSICLSAWNTQDYIEECLDSIAAQTWFKTHDNWEILLGIDACEKTLAKVKQIMHKYKNLSVYMMNENVGTYVTCNTIMKLARYEWLLRFDTDDVMPNDMLEKIFSNNLNGIDFIQYSHKDFGIKDNYGLAWGSHMVKRSIWNKFGGYRNWRISGDYDFLYRIKPQTQHLELNNIFYLRRCHMDSLEHDQSTDMKSELRKKLNNFVLTQSRNESIIICTTASCDKIAIHDSVGKKYNGEKAIISLTSWKARINNTHTTIYNILNQCPNFHIVLVLSSDEFKTKENDLPASLMTLVRNKRIELLWVGKNYKAFKKVLPTIQKYKTIPVISADDDLIYTRNYAQELLDEFNKDKNIATISYRHSKMITNCGAATLYNPIYFQDILPIIDESVIDTLEDDMFIQYIITKCQYKQTFLNSGFPFVIGNESGETLNSKYKLKGTARERYQRNCDIYARSIWKNAPVHLNLTTFPKRDKCLEAMLTNIKSQSLHPDKTILWLSEDEYDKNNLPVSISKCLSKGLLDEIMWCPKNIYGHKKHQCFKYFNYCYNVELDDDTLYKPNVICDMVENAKRNPNCITCYSTRSVDYDGLKVIQKPAIISASSYNAYMGGRTCFPPFIYPMDAFTKSEMRDKYVTKCDEGWLRPFLIKYGIMTYALHNWDNNDYPLITDSQEVSLWSENRQTYRNGMREKERNFYNGIKINGVEKEVKKLFPHIGIDNWTLKTKEEML